MYNIAYNGSDWEEPVIIAPNGAHPWGFYPDINATAKWVWTSDGASLIYCRLPVCEYA